MNTLESSTDTAPVVTNGLVAERFEYAHAFSGSKSTGTRLFNEHDTVPVVYIGDDGTVEFADDRLSLELAATWFRDVADHLILLIVAQETYAVPSTTMIMPTAADVLAIAEHYATAFVEVDGWVNTLVGAVVYKAPTDAAVS